MTAPNLKPTKASSAGSFKKGNAPLIELPSGHFVRIRRPGMEAFLSAGFLPDSLAKEISKMISRRTGKAEDLNILQDPTPEAVREYLRAMDRIAAHCITEPKVIWHERQTGEENADGQPALEIIPEGERDEGLVYTDDLDIQDKTFVFQYAVGGTADLTQFRRESDAAVAALQPSGGVGEAPERDIVPE